MTRCGNGYSSRRRKLSYYATATFLICYVSGTFYAINQKNAASASTFSEGGKKKGSAATDDSGRRHLLDSGAKNDPRRPFLTPIQTTPPEKVKPVRVTLPPPIQGYDLDVNHSWMHIQYEPYAIREPFFATDEDRDYFFNLPDNMTKEIGVVQPDRLRGVITIIADATASDIQDCGYNSRLEVFQPVLNYNHNRGRRRVPTDKKAFLSPLLVPASDSFQHFVDGVLPKIAQSYELLRAWNVTLLIYAPKDPIIREIYQALHFPTRHLLSYKTGDYVSDFQINTCITPPMHPVLWQKIRTLLEVPSAVSNSASDVVLFVRKTNARSIQNLKQVTNYLTARYSSRFKVINRGLHDLESAKEAMSSAGVIIGVHGGAFYNMLFAPPKTAIVEVMPMSKKGATAPRMLAHTIIWRVAQSMGHNYWRVSVQSSTPLGDLSIPLDRLEATLDEVDNTLALNKML